MSPRSAAAAIADTLHPPLRPRTRTRPAPARRRSGAARPRTQTRPARATRARSRAAGPDLVALLDRLLRGPAYIALVAVLLAGIVFFNVDVLELNHGIASTDVRATQLERQNAALTQQLARLASSERIQTLAIQRGFVLPQPGDVGYLRATPSDATRAARTMTGPQATSTAAPTLVTQSSAPSTTPTTPTTTPAPSSQLPAQAAASPAQPATP